MKTYSRPHRNEQALLLDAAVHHGQEHQGRNRLVADIAEIDARKVYRRAGYDSILSYCIGEFDLTRKAALHRIHVARTAWRYPVVLAALSQGRLHVASVRLIASKLTVENAEELVDAAANMPLAKVIQLLRTRFPKSEAPALLLEAQSGAEPGTLAGMAPVVPALPEPERPLKGAETVGPAPLAEPERPSRGVEAPPATTIVPPLPPRFPLKANLTRETHEKLRYARELLGHQVPSGDVADVIDRALDSLIARLEKQKFATTEKPRTQKPAKTANGRHIPAAVKRAVAERDGRRCTFVAESGKRCESRSRLEYDHIVEVARGGHSTVDNIRLRCRAHNQLTAEGTFGPDFMDRKRQEARQGVSASGLRTLVRCT
jgi:hypothetical protein